MKGQLIFSIQLQTFYFVGLLTARASALIPIISITTVHEKFLTLQKVTI